jgi:predicted DNA-binding transcriptional regulator YafY
MWDTPGRLLRLLELLQFQSDWSVADLAAKLDVSERTVRRDAARLREIGYPIDSWSGVGGGYRLAPGASLPPLMFDADEAVATVLALQANSLDGTRSVSGSTLRALTKLIKVMPARLRNRIEALNNQASYTPHGAIIGQEDAAVNIETLISAAVGCQEHRQATVRYHAVDDPDEPRDVDIEPFRLVHAGGNWYLVAWELTAHDWQIFRMDRFTHFELHTKPSAHRQPPSDDVEAYVIAQLGTQMQAQRAVVRVHAPRAAVAHWIDPVWGRIEDFGDECVLHVGADSLAGIARWLLLLDADLTVLEPPELATAFAALADRAARAANSLPAS